MCLFQKNKRQLVMQSERARKVLADTFSDMKSFKSDELKPFLKKRVSGTKANKAVQKVSNRLIDQKWILPGRNIL